MFFCFKQKTAYEMRISDWSSDVCSSDLVPDHVGLYSRAVPAAARRPSWLADIPRDAGDGTGAAPRELAGGAAWRAVRRGAARGVDRGPASRRAVRGACRAALGNARKNRGSRASLRL